MVFQSFSGNNSMALTSNFLVSILGYSVAYVEKQVKAFHASRLFQTEKCRAFCYENELGDLVPKEDKVPLWLFCESCRRYLRINPSCNKRNCERCQKKQTRRLIKNYLPFVKTLQPRGSQNLRMLTLSGFQYKGGNLKAQCESFFNVVSGYLGEFYEGGLVTLEFLNSYGELHIHAHALVYGGFKLRSDFGKEFAGRLYVAGLITYWERQKGYYNGEWYTWMQTVRRKEGALWYCVKYIAKGSLSDELVETMKGLRFVRTFGIFRGIEGNKSKAICADCGGKVCFWYGELSEFGPLDHPLKIKYVEDPP